MKQGLFTILNNEKLAKDTYRMVLQGDTGAITGPGQFVNIALEGCFLRRPISVCDYGPDSLTIIYKVVGRGTAQMSCLPAGTELDLLTGMIWRNPETNPCSSAAGPGFRPCMPWRNGFWNRGSTPR